MLARGAVHVNIGGSSHIHADLGGVVHPDAVLDGLYIEAGFTKFLRDVIRCRFVFGRTGNMRCLSQNAEMLFSELGIRNSKEPSFLRCFRRRITKTKDGAGGLRCSVSSLALRKA